MPLVLIPEATVTKGLSVLGKGTMVSFSLNVGTHLVTVTGAIVYEVLRRREARREASAAEAARRAEDITEGGGALAMAPA